MFKDILILFFQNECGYLRFFPLSGVSQAHLGKRISLRDIQTDTKKRRGNTILCYLIFFS